MAFPSLTEYQAAIQNPQLCLNDKVLRALKPRLTPLGMPHALSGGFSLIFIMENNTIQYALKCYYKEMKNLEKRYIAISEFLETNPMDDFLAYEYQPEAIYINEKWWPALKMDYLQASELRKYVEDYLDDADALKSLQKKFRKLIQRLDKVGMAHGDLQHGNILIDSSGDIRLIDYDGMYTPNMRFKKSNEIGHENFQHPDRSTSDFHARIDRFSAIVIDLTLDALQKDPDLWDHYYDGENLLLKKGDFESPDSSEVLREIERLDDMAQKVKDFRLLCRLDMEALPSLKNWYSGNYDLEKWEEAQSAEAIPKKKKKRVISQFPVVGALDKQRLLEYEGQVITVYGKVTHIHKGVTKYNKPYVFMNFADWRQGHFKLTIWSEGLEYLQGRGIDVNDYEECVISFTGLMEEYNGIPGITFSPEKADKINKVSGEDRSRLDREAKLWREEDDNQEYTINTRAEKSGSNAEYWQSASQSNRDILRDIQASSKKKNTPSSSKSSSGNCWIAGAVFDDPLHPRVMELRRWRDEVLRSRWWGRILIRLYYWTGPMASQCLRRYPVVMAWIRKFLEGRR